MQLPSIYSSLNNTSFKIWQNYNHPNENNYTTITFYGNNTFNKSKELLSNQYSYFICTQQIPKSERIQPNILAFNYIDLFYLVYKQRCMEKTVD